MGCFANVIDGSLDYGNRITLATATWTVSSKTITQTAAFTNYCHQTGDKLLITGGTGATAGIYVIASKTSADAIVLTTDVAAGNLATGDITGYILNAAGPPITDVVGTVVKQRTARDTTHGGLADAEVTAGRSFWYVQGSGFYQVSGQYPSVLGQPIANGPLSRILQVRVRRVRGVENLTGADNDVNTATFNKQRARYSGTGFGVLRPTEFKAASIWESNSIASAKVANFTIPIAATVTDPVGLRGDIIIRTLTTNLQFAQGGSVRVPFSFQFTGPVLVQSNGDNVQVMDNPFLSDYFGPTLKLDNGRVMTVAAGGKGIVPEVLEAQIDFQNALPIQFTFRGPIDGAASFADG